MLPVAGFLRWPMEGPGDTDAHILTIDLHDHVCLLSAIVDVGDLGLGLDEECDLTAV